MTTLVPGTGVLFIVPSQRVCAKIIPWRRIYDPTHWRVIPPHITLAYPFVRGEDWVEVQPAIAASLQAIAPFWVTVAELGVFEAPQAVLWFHPDAGDALTRLHAALCKQFPTYVQAGPLGFTPHLTVGFFDTLDTMAQARAKITAVWQPVRFRVRGLCYATFQEDRIWHICDELPLGG